MAKEYKIASFNAQGLSFNSSTDKLEYISEIIQNEDFDIVGVQEVFTEGKAWSGASIESEMNMRFLKYNLPRWDCRYCKPSKENARTSDQRGEGFFLIWKRSSFKLADYKDINDTKMRVFEPRIINEESKDTYKDIPPMARMPMYARLVATNDRELEFRIINVHLYEGGKKQDSFCGRLEEFRTTINEIYSGVNGRVYGSRVKPYTIIMGDYNLIINDELALKSEVTMRFGPYIKAINVNTDGKNIITEQKEPTTLCKPRTDEYGVERMPENPYTNSFDHFSYDVDYFNDRNLCVNIRRMSIEDCIRHSPKKYETKALEYRKIISDHVPIVMEIRFL